MNEEKQAKQYFPNEELPIGLWRVENQPPTENHSHSFIEIVVVEEGRGCHLFDGLEVPSRAGDVFVVHEGCSHAWKETQGLSVLNIMLTDLKAIPQFAELRHHRGFGPLFLYEPNLRPQQKGRAFLHLQREQLGEVVQISRRLDHALHQGEHPYTMIANTLLMSLVSLLCESYLAAPRKAQQSLLRVGDAIKKLEEGWQAPPGNEELAADMHVSPATFYRLFRQATGTTPADYLNRLRVEKACELLRETDKSITEIAFQVGFGDSNYFSRAFRKIRGQSPRQCRQG